MYLVNPVDTGNPQFVERALLDAIDKPDPHLAGLSHTEGNIQDRPNLIAADHRIEQRLAQHRVLRVALVDHHPGRQLAHLPDLLFEGHLLEQLPDAGFYLFIGAMAGGIRVHAANPPSKPRNKIGIFFILPTFIF